MNSARLASLALIVGGILALAYGGFSYTRETHRATLGTLELTVRDQERVNVPAWAGVGALVLGGALFFFGGTRR